MIDMREAEQMALAVLKGDVVAAAALADMLMMSVDSREVRMPPVSRINIPVERIRVAVTLLPDATATLAEAREASYRPIVAWLRGNDKILFLKGLKIDLYEMPKIPLMYQMPSPNVAGVDD
jgi:hypothetical protein